MKCKTWKLYDKFILHSRFSKKYIYTITKKIESFSNRKRGKERAQTNPLVYSDSLIQNVDN